MREPDDLQCKLYAEYLCKALWELDTLPPFFIMNSCYNKCCSEFIKVQFSEIESFQNTLLAHHPRFKCTSSSSLSIQILLAGM